ncbi:MAG: type II toxin-antitoxin system RelE/ParE family toxin [Moorea sp. SIO3C2]|nr:type II toxin-antitoxin system RelE/ParE family toxin [Moorena sp. SIO3C2]
MEPIEREVRIYTARDGKCPFEKWIRGLKDRRGKTMIRTRINRMRMGNLGDNKSVGEGVSEMRIAFGPGYRVYFAIDAGAVVVLLCGGDKGTQESDIERAKRYWKDYQHAV